MSRIQFVTIEGKPYRWKDILALRRLQSTANGKPANQLPLFIALPRQPTNKRPDCVRSLLAAKPL